MLEGEFYCKSRMEKTDHNMTQFIDKIMENISKLIKVYKKMQKTAKRKKPINTPPLQNGKDK